MMQETLRPTAHQSFPSPGGQVNDPTLGYDTDEATFCRLFTPDGGEATAIRMTALPASAIPANFRGSVIIEIVGDWHTSVPDGLDRLYIFARPQGTDEWDVVMSVQPRNLFDGLSTRLVDITDLMDAFPNTDWEFQVQFANSPADPDKPTPGGS